MAAWLFRVEGNIVHPNTETLLLSPFKEIWERDQDPKKRNALEDFTYIEFMSSVLKSNPFHGYEESLRHSKIIEKCITQENWKPDELILKGIQEIHRFQTEASSSYTYYISVKKAVERMRGFFDEVDLNEKNLKSGNPLYKPKDITSAIVDTEKVLANLKLLEAKIHEELLENTRNKAQKTISIFANPESINE